MLQSRDDMKMAEAEDLSVTPLLGNKVQDMLDLITKTLGTYWNTWQEDQAK